MVSVEAALQVDEPGFICFLPALRIVLSPSSFHAVAYQSNSSGSKLRLPGKRFGGDGERKVESGRMGGLY
jgi:hypothetical protein